MYLLSAFEAGPLADAELLGENVVEIDQESQRLTASLGDGNGSRAVRRGPLAEVLSTVVAARREHDGAQDQCHGDAHSLRKPETHECYPSGSGGSHALTDQYAGDIVGRRLVGAHVLGMPTGAFVYVVARSTPPT